MSSLLVHLDFQEDALNFKKPIPIRFSIKDIELLGNGLKGTECNPWQKGWVHLFAAEGLYMLWASKNIPEGTGIAIDENATTILFKTINDSVTVCSTQVNIAAEINFDILFEAWRLFGQRVHKVFVQRHPEMSVYPWWPILYDLPTFVSTLNTNPYWYKNPDPSWYEND